MDAVLRGREGRVGRDDLRGGEGRAWGEASGRRRWDHPHRLVARPNVARDDRAAGRQVVRRPLRRARRRGRVVEADRAERDVERGRVSDEAAEPRLREGQAGAGRVRHARGVV